jgi:hypothetical protein
MSYRHGYLVLLRGDPGVGKTRLIQEFFSWLSCHHDDHNYWGDRLADTNKALTLVPTLPDRLVVATPDLPWLWLAVRCQEPAHVSDGVVAFDAIRHQIALHLAGLFQAQRRRAVNINLVKGDSDSFRRSRCRAAALSSRRSQWRSIAVVNGLAF